MTSVFFENRWTTRPSSTQPGVREPRENRGRLRHCNGLQTPTGHCSAHAFMRGGGKAGARLSPKSGYRSGCARRGPVLRPQMIRGTGMGQLLRQEKDEASLLRECETGFVGCLHSPFCRGLKVFVFRFSGLAATPKTIPGTPRWSLNRNPSVRVLYSKARTGGNSRKISIC